MLIQIATILLAVWLLGMITSLTAYGFIHVLLLAGFILLIIGVAISKDKINWHHQH